MGETIGNRENKQQTKTVFFSIVRL